ncbi:hypothetical protein BGZ49_005573, partial [Haplosporangium sp. Z 27]
PEWKALQTGRDLLSMRYPSISLHLTTADIEIVKSDLSPGHVISEVDVQHLLDIPSLSMARKIVQVIVESIEANGGDNCDENEVTHYARILGLGVYTLRAAKFLIATAECIEFSDRLRLMLQWLDGSIKTQDSAFADWLRSILLDDSGIMTRTFKPTPGASLAINSVFFLMGEEYIDDEVIRVVLEILSEHYRVDDQFVFIPPIMMQLWRQST